MIINIFIKMNVTYQLLVYDHGVNLLGKNINTKHHKENHRALLHPSKEAGLQANTEKTKYVCLVTRTQDKIII
jgi:hypothetical protein